MSSLIDEKINIKVLIMFVLDKIGFYVTKDDLGEICCSELNYDYFSFSDCLYELIDSGHVAEKKDLYSITIKGKNNVAALYDSLPYSTRKKAEKLSAPIKEKLSRQSMITAEHIKKGDSVKVHLELSDGKGDVFNLEMLCPNEAVAEKIEKKFKNDAEGYYMSIIELFN